ncbi:MAG TPA: response regulator transcription factor [Dehalococcoidia bacterium]|nr:response regulator transcription factor [Dehalococcoidia bacterium]
MRHTNTRGGHTPIRLFVIDHEELYRKGLSLLFSRDADIRVVGQARDALDACDSVRRVQPDIVLVGLNSRDGDSIARIKAIRDALPSAQVALMADRFTRADIVGAASAGVRGYITKDVQIGTLINAIKSVSRGEVFMPPSSSAMLVEEIASMNGDRGQEPATSVLDRAKVTDRERDVLQLLVQGATNRDIAGRLHISENTVKVHLRNILDKLHLRNRQQAAAFAVSSGLVRLRRDDTNGAA